MTQGDDGEWQGHEEDRPPPEVLEQRCPRRADRGREIAPPIADQSAIDRVRAGPDHRAVISASVVGKAMPADEAAEHAGDERAPCRSVRTPRAGMRAPTATPRGSASACARSGRRAHRGRGPTPRGRASSPTAMRSSVVCEEPNAWPIEGSATLATERFRFATAATRIRARSTSPARSGAVRPRLSPSPRSWSSPLPPLDWWSVEHPDLATTSSQPDACLAGPAGLRCRRRGHLRKPHAGTGKRPSRAKGRPGRPRVEAFGSPTSACTRRRPTLPAPVDRPMLSSSRSPPSR